MPSSVQNFFVEIKTINAYLILLSFAASTNFAWFQHRLGFNDVSWRFKRDIFFRISIKYTEKIIIAARHYWAILAIPTALKLVKDAVIFIQRA